MILFAPLGVAIAVRRVSPMKACAAGALFSIAIEAAQLFVVPGRHANLGDVLGNTAGVIVGYVFIRAQPWTTARKFGLRRSLLTGLAVITVLIAGLTLLTQTFSQPTYWLQWTARYKGHDLYRGKVLETRLGPLEWRDAPQAMEPGDSVRELFKRYPIHSRFIVGPPTRRLAPIVSIHDGTDAEIIQLGVDHTDFIFRYWGAADDARLDHADLRVERWFAAAAPGDTVDMSFRFTRAGYCLTLNERSECAPGFSVADTWSLLMSMDWSNARSRATGLAWLMLVFFPVGFVTRDKPVLLAVVGLSIVSLIAGPMLVGFAITRWYQIIAAVLGLLIGHMFAGLFLRPGTMPSSQLSEPLQPSRVA